MKRFIVLSTCLFFLNSHCMIQDPLLPEEWNTLSRHQRYQTLINAGGTLDADLWNTMTPETQYETLFDLIAENNRAQQAQQNPTEQEQWQRMTNDQRYARYLEQATQNNHDADPTFIDEETWQTLPADIQYDIIRDMNINQNERQAMHQQAQNRNNNQQEPQTQECNICMEDKQNTVAMTCCRDKIICQDCLARIIADAQAQHTTPTCPFCRQDINQQLRDRLTNRNNFANVQQNAQQSNQEHEREYEEELRRNFQQPHHHHHNGHHLVYVNGQLVAAY